jgi:hypothetical protein
MSEERERQPSRQSPCAAGPRPAAFPFGHPDFALRVTVSQFAAVGDWTVFELPGAP